MAGRSRGLSQGGKGAAWKAIFAGASLALIFGLGLAVSPTSAQEAISRETALSAVSLGSLPVEVRSTELLVRSGGPFPYSKDGIVFGNRERLLPSRPRGYYREYTVRTPGSRDRGARRLVCGGDLPRAPHACFYTDDHYASFRQVAP
jgi:ribonuclease T1